MLLVFGAALAVHGIMQLKNPAFVFPRDMSTFMIGVALCVVGLIFVFGLKAKDVIDDFTKLE